MGVFVRAYLLALCGVLAGTAASCGVVESDLTRPQGTTFWEPFQFGESLEGSRFETLRELHNASDAVVTARVSGVRRSRVIEGDAAEDQVAMVCVDIQVEAVIAGDAPETLCLEFIGGSLVAAQAIVQRALAVGFPRQPAVLFLHEKLGNGEDGLYRVTNSTGLWAATSRAIFDTPLRPEDPTRSDLYEDELADVDTIAELVELLRRM
jgi:hypothetical protein